MALTLRLFSWFEQLQTQCCDLDWHTPQSWPPIPRYFSLIGSSLLLFFIGYFVYLSPLQQQLKAQQQQIQQLYHEYQSKKHSVQRLDYLNTEIARLNEQLSAQFLHSISMPEIFEKISAFSYKNALEFELIQPKNSNKLPHYSATELYLKVYGDYSNMINFIKELNQWMRTLILGDWRFTYQNQNVYFEATLILLQLDA